MTHNRLGTETSPYLKQHEDNPVHWYPWGDEALTAAQAENKPILLSIGYAACHWCHVMAHESFEDPATAAIMNKLFINIKVDREERPDVDTIYQTALQLTGEQGGWPLTMFLTPNGDPFWGGTYFPNPPRYGRPGFSHVLESVASTFANDQNGVAKNVAALRDGLNQALTPSGGGALSVDVLDQAAHAAAQHVDPDRGGTNGAPKFPQPMFFRLLWHAYLRNGSTAFRDAVTVTLDNICQGGIYDHLGGGFARYSTDERWLAPHFEKMLYDNALLMELMSDVWLTTKSPLYAARIAETIAWLEREMAAEHDGQGRYGYASALDADSEGEEGKFYVWDKAEVDAVLGDNAEAFNALYDVNPAGNWEGQTILNRLNTMDWDPEQEAQMAPLRQKLLAARARRIHPGRDGKVLADWNGMTIAALTRAGVVFDRPDWIALGQSVFAWIKDNMVAKDARLRHSRCDGQLQHPAVLDDYAQMARAALLLAEATADQAYVGDAETWAEVVEKHYSDGTGRGYDMAAWDTTGLVARPKPSMDNAVPSGNGTMADVLARLALVTGKAVYRDRAETLFAAFALERAEANLQHPTLLVAWELLNTGLQVVVIGDADDEKTTALFQAALQAPNRNAVVTCLAPDAVLPKGHAASGKTAINDKATAYICIGPTCGLPITDPDTLAATLAPSK